MMRHRPLISGRVLGYRAVQVLGYVRDTIAEDGEAPSYGMIRDALGLSSREKVRRIVVGLEKRALLSRVGSGRVRRIRL
jgi:transcriptional regulator of NAD metabolism